MEPNTPRRTVAHVLHRLYRAGAEVLAADLARRLGSPEGLRFVFICLDELGPMAEQLRAEGYPVVSLDRRPGIDRGAARRMAATLAEHAVDLVHAHQYGPFFYSALARGWMGSRPPILFTEHGRHFPDERKLKHLLVNAVLLKRGDRVTAVGEHVKALLSRNEGIPARRVEVVLNGIDAGAFTPAPGAREAARRALGLRDEQPAFLQVARFHSVKDHETSVRAFAHAAAALPGAVLLLAGAGGEQARIEGWVRELGLGDAVRFLGVREDVPSLLAAADVFVLSSLSEGISVTLLEAMAASLPIVATGVGGNPEVVLHGETGLLSPRRDARAMGLNLAALATDARRRAQMGAAGRRRVETVFTQERMHRRYAALYGEMLAR
jgi:glycosyltransferase involved in cell wall biosynthesis